MLFLNSEIVSLDSFAIKVVGDESLLPKPPLPPLPPLATFVFAETPPRSSEVKPFTSFAAVASSDPVFILNVVIGVANVSSSSFSFTSSFLLVPGGGGKGDAYEGASWEDSRFTEQELKNRYAKFKSESKSRAENSKWWREEKKEAEKNKKEFNEKAFQARARKAGRDAERLKRSGGFVARTGYVWQDAMVGMVSVAICIGAGTYINRKMEQRAREKHHEEYSMTNAPPVPQKNDGDGGNDDVQNK
mmetsp:Transcript_3821/g.12693  ORF Transcript_3821/g.12693 Transcript_3821/m.12693 type:complete len:246 (-) Transcript_3821:130-867(-)